MASHKCVFIRTQWEVPVYGKLAKLIRKGVRLRQWLTDARTRAVESEIIWERQPHDTQFYGNHNYPRCEANGRCLRCLFCFRRFASTAFYFDPLQTDLLGPREWEDDMWTLIDLGFLP